MLSFFTTAPQSYWPFPVFVHTRDVPWGIMQPMQISNAHGTDQYIPHQAVY
jgi:hypothetical protein